MKTSAVMRVRVIVHTKGGGRGSVGSHGVARRRQDEENKQGGWVVVVLPKGDMVRSLERVKGQKKASKRRKK